MAAVQASYMHLAMASGLVRCAVSSIVEEKELCTAGLIKDERAWINYLVRITRND